MRQSDHTDTVHLLAEAETAAARLRRRLPSSIDHDDLRQELLTDLIRRLPAYDPARSTLGAFAGHILRNQAARIASRVMRERRATGGRLLSLDAATADGTSLGDTLAEDDGLASWHGRSSATLAAERCIDVARVLGELDPPERDFCAAVAHWSLDQLVDRGFGSRASLYRRLRSLRPVLAAYGLQAA